MPGGRAQMACLDLPDMQQVDCSAGLACQTVNAPCIGRVCVMLNSQQQQDKGP